MESIKSWFQDWSDACEYAKECAPDFSFLSVPEPYSALGFFALVCFAVWWVNERGLKRLQKLEQAPSQTSSAAGAKPDGLNQMLEQMQSVSRLPSEQAA